MKKIISLLLIVALLFSLCSLASCGKDEEAKSVTSSKSQSKNISSTSSKNVSSDVSSANASSTTSSAVVELPAYTKNSGEISVNSSFIDYEDNNWWKNFFKYYKEECGGTVKLKGISWQNWEVDYIKDFASGTANDLIYFYPESWPKLAKRGMVYSVQQMKNKGVVGFDHPYLTDGLDQVASSYTMNGQCYTFAKKIAEPTVIFVNEDMFKQYGVKSPSEYYKEGTWNWENFEKCSKQLTRDINNDDAFVIHAYTGWDPHWMVNAAGGQLVTANKDGTVSLTIDSKESIQGLNNIRNYYGVLKCSSNNTGQFEFINEKVGMFGGLPRNMNNYLFGEDKYDELAFNWSVVPFPLDTRTNKKNMRSGQSYAWAVNSKSDNPQGCVNFIIAYNTYCKTKPNPDDINLEKYFTSEQMKMINDGSRNIVNPIYQGVGDLYFSQWKFWTAIKTTDSTIQEVLDTYKPAFQEQVNLENEMKTDIKK